MQVRLCRAKGTGEIYAMKKLKKSEMLSRGQVMAVKLGTYSAYILLYYFNAAHYKEKENLGFTCLFS